MEATLKIAGANPRKAMAGNVKYLGQFHGKAMVDLAEIPANFHWYSIEKYLGRFHGNPMA